MLEKYSISQPFFYNLVNKQIKSGQLSHAYLIDENNNDEAFDIILSFVKEIVCNGIIDEHICNRIDDGNYPELKVIELEGTLIKKNQIIQLQQEFSRLSLEGNRRIYIIRDCDKMRSETANSMLKFLEEPDGAIIAILMTNNIGGVLPTIISRCQMIKLLASNQKYEKNEIYDIALNLIYMASIKKNRAVFEEKQLLFDFVSIKERNKIVDIIDKMIDIFYDMLNKPELIIDEKIKQIMLLNNENSIIEKIMFLVEAKDSVKYNVNINLLVDTIILNIGGNNNDGRRN